MAHMSQTRKKIIAAKLKEVMKQFPKVKYSLSVQHHMTLVMTISAGDKCLQPTHPDGYCNVNTYWIDSHYKNNPEAAKILKAAIACLNDGNHDNSDMMTDYFDVGWYVDVNIGSYKKPFVGV